MVFNYFRRAFLRYRRSFGLDLWLMGIKLVCVGTLEDFCYGGEIGRKASTSFLKESNEALFRWTILEMMGDKFKYYIKKYKWKDDKI